MSKIRSSQNIYRIVALILVVSGLVIGIYSFVHMSNNSYKLNEIGDFLGGTVGAFWGISGLILVYVAFLGQKEQLMNQEEELKLSREEQKLTREEIKGQREQMELQNKTISSEQFENSFFKLLNYHDQNTEYLLKAVYGTYIGGGFKDVEKESIKVGKKAFPRLEGLFSKGISRTDEVDTEKEIRKMYLYLKDRFKEDMEFGEELDIYCRSLYNIIDFIDQSSVENKLLYSNVVTNQMPVSEKIVLIYMTIIADEKSMFFDLANKYGLFKNVLEHIDRTDNKFLWSTLKYFENSAFGVSREFFDQIKLLKGA